MLAFFAIVFGIIYLDQLSKWLAVTFLKGEESFSVINGVLRFTYVENRGAAFGMLSDNRWIFLLISAVMIVAIIVYMVKWRPKSKLFYVAAAFVVGGGVGNMIDRIFLGYVIDFIDFCAFPNLWVWVFNIADSFVCIGAGMLMLWIIISTINESKEEKKKAAELLEQSNSENDTGDRPAKEQDEETEKASESEESKGE